MASFKTLIASLAALTLSLCGARLLAAELDDNSWESDSDVEAIDFDSSDFNENEFETSDFDTTGLDPAASSNRLLQHLKDGAKWSYRHDAIYSEGNINQLSQNRSMLRLEWQYGWDNYLVHLDALADYDWAYNDKLYNSQLRQNYRQQQQFREFYFQASFDALSITLGKQVVIWGKADSAQVTDIISPRNLRNSIYTSLEDARLGQKLLQLNYFIGADYDANGRQISPQQQWTLIVNPDRRFDQLAPAGHPYGVDTDLLRQQLEGQLIANLPADILAQLLSQPHLLQRRQSQEREFDLGAPELGLRYLYSRGKLDLAFMLADVYANQAHLDFDLQALDNAGLPLIQQRYEKYPLIGTGLNWAYRNWLFKAELAYKFNRVFSCLDFDGCQLHAARSDVVDAALGFDFNANGRYNLSLELSQQYLRQWRPGLLLQAEQNTAAYLIWSKNFAHETLTSRYTSSYLFQAGDSFHRFELIYDLSDAIELELQLDYFASDRGVSGLGALADKHSLGLSILVSW